MHILDLIIKKRCQERLSGEEIDFLIQGYNQGKIPDYQMAAFLMAGFLRGFDLAETRSLTKSLLSSGEVLDLNDLNGIKVDKHSTGGVGDKTTLVLVPLLAAAGLTVVKMAGRALGHTGGTIDKLESIPGFQAELSSKQLKAVASKVGAVISGQTKELVPADKKLYALRDVTGTVESPAYIASSIVSKKLAGGAQYIVFDVKTGDGSFFSSIDQAVELASLMVSLIREFDRKAVAVLSSMAQPLGYAVGNALEVVEACQTLKGKGPADLLELCLVLGSQVLTLTGLAPNQERAKEILNNLLMHGAGMAKMKEMITAQGGDPRVIDDLNLLPQASYQKPVKALTDGYVQEIKAKEIGKAAILTGAGRFCKEAVIDPAAGLVLRKKVGDWVDLGETLAVIHTNKKDFLQEIEAIINKAFLFSFTPPKHSPLIQAVWK